MSPKSILKLNYSREISWFDCSDERFGITRKMLFSSSNPLFFSECSILVLGPWLWDFIYVFASFYCYRGGCADPSQCFHVSKHIKSRLTKTKEKQMFSRSLQIFKLVLKTQNDASHKLYAKWPQVIPNDVATLFRLFVLNFFNEKKPT